MIGDRDKIHPALAQQPIEIPRIGITVRKIEPPKEPFLGTRAEAGMNVEIAKAHARKGLNAAAGALLRDPVPICRRGPIFDQSIGQAQDLSPDLRMIHDRVDECLRGREAPRRVDEPARRSTPGSRRDASRCARCRRVFARENYLRNASRARPVSRVVYSISASAAARSAAEPSSQAGAIKPRGVNPASANSSRACVIRRNASS